MQGTEAAGEIASAIKTVGKTLDRFRWDCLIVGRGGGSIEDLAPFNDEIVARAVAASAVPVISAVGHEIDTTICDFAADLRMPTPTAAAEWIVSRHESIHRDLAECGERMSFSVRVLLNRAAQRLDAVEKRLVHPGRRLEDLKLRVDERLERLILAMRRKLDRSVSDGAHATERLLRCRPDDEIRRRRELVDRLQRELLLHWKKILDERRSELRTAAGLLDGLSPLAVLARGYAVVYRLPGKQVVRKAHEVKLGQEISVRLSEGYLECTVRERGE